MSELKEIGIRWEENGELHFSHVYLKSEADKVIAEKDKEIAELKHQVWEADERAIDAGATCNEKMQESDHHKRKRCLAMARWCGEKWADIATPYGKSVWYNKWQKRWLELAEKFKEAE